MPGIGIGISPHFQQKKSLSSYWTPQIAANIDAQYYWWDNANAGDTRRLRILHALSGGVKGIDYFIDKASDARYEITNIQLCDLVDNKNGVINPTQYQNYVGLNSKMDSLTFTGTRVTQYIAKTSASGIYRAFLLPGSRTFRGQIKTALIATVNADKQNGYFYEVEAAGDYSAIDVSLSSLLLHDVILYENSTWTIYHEADYDYVDIDAYNATTINVTVTLFDSLTLGTYTMGLHALGTQNPSSSGARIYPTSDTTLTNRPFRIYGGTPNSTENEVSLNNTGAAHWDMSLKIKKNGTAQTAGWIPEHATTSGTQLNYHSGEDVQYDADGTPITGYNTGDQGCVAVENFILTNESYAVNVGAPEEELLKVTTVITFTKSGINIQNTYLGLVETLAETIYSYMLPWSTVIFNKWVSDYKQELALPGNGVTTNVTDGGNRKDVMVYNDTAEGTYENYLIAISIPDPATTNKASTQTSFLYNYGTTYGKFYLTAAVNDIISVGESYTTEINVLAGRITGLIALVDSYVGS